MEKSESDKVKVNNTEHSQRRRACISGSKMIDPECKEFIAVTKIIESYTCSYCGAVFVDVPTVDHMVPLSRGGAHAVSNLTLACQPCNSGKCAKTAEEYMEYRRRLSCVAV